MRRSGYGAVTVAVALVAVLAGMAGSTRLADAISRPPAHTSGHLPVPTLGEWFSGASADFRFKTRLTVADMPSADAQFGNGAHLTAAPDEPSTWYVFGRRTARVQPVPACDALPLAFGIDIWKSTDHGTTWSEPSTLVAPTEGTPWSCFAGDGDAYYDRVARTWHYLAQCRGRDNRWNGCHWTRAGSDPMGEWQPDPANPVVSTAPGSTSNLWQRICQPGPASGTGGPPPNCFQDSQKDSVATVSDAGTFTIFDVPTDSGYHYVRFHGVAASNAHQYTGLAKTADFVNWVVGPDDPAHLPSDDIFDSRFPKGVPPGDGHGAATAWREPHWLPPNSSDAVIGGGGGHVAYEAPWYYLVAEASDRPLCGLPGTTWDLGIYRTADVRNTVWDSPARPHENPLAFSSDSVAGSPEPSSCDPSYPRLLKDPATGETELVYNRIIRTPGGPEAPADPTRSGLYVYTLRWNLLSGGRPGDEPRGLSGPPSGGPGASDQPSDQPSGPPSGGPGPSGPPSGGPGPSGLPALIPPGQARAAPWWVIPAGADPPAPSALTTRRDAYQSPDGNGYLAFNCGGVPPACGPSKAIYQDVPLVHGKAPPTTSYVFGGKAAALGGGTGKVQFVVGQLDKAGRWLRTDAVSANVAGTDYSDVTSAPVALRSDAVWLRYMVWVNGERFTVKVGEPFIEPRL